MVLAACVVTSSLGACGAAPGEDEQGSDELTEALRRRPPHQPAAPTFSDVSQVSVAVSWVAVRFADASELERAPDVGGAPGAFTSVVTTAATRHVDGSLSPATTYWYRLRCSNAYGWSTHSPAAKVTTAGTMPTPDPVVTPTPTPDPVVTPPAPAPAPAATTLRDAAARHGMVFGTGWGPPPWTMHETIARTQYNSYALPGSVGAIWKGPGSYDWWNPDVGVQYALNNPGFEYGSAQLFYGVFLGANNHALVPAWLRGPDSSTRYGAPTVSPEQLSQLMRDFLIAYVQRYGTGCHRTEIANELVTDAPADWYYMNSSIGYAGGKTVAQYIDQLARWAKAANPNVKLFVNDNRNEDTQTISGVGNAFGALAVELKAMGTPIDGLGFQCHELREIPYNYDSVQGVFAYFASLGYDLHITEMGIPAPVGPDGLVSAADQERQAAQYRALVGAFLRGGGARAKSISSWGTTDVNAFDRGGLLFDVNGNKKAAFYAVMEVLNQQ
jgi:GH35 family endo-1,4-beta-xylanase